MTQVLLILLERPSRIFLTFFALTILGLALELLHNPPPRDTRPLFVAKLAPSTMPPN